MILVKIFYSILLLGAGILILKYRKTVKSWTGNLLWAEKYLGNGGTYFIITLVGVFLIFGGLIYPFGGFDFLIGGSDGLGQK